MGVESGVDASLRERVRTRSKNFLSILGQNVALELMNIIMSSNKKSIAI